MAVLLGTIDTAGVTGTSIMIAPEPTVNSGALISDINKVGNVVSKRNKNGVDSTDGEWDGISITFTDPNGGTVWEEITDVHKNATLADGVYTQHTYEVITADSLPTVVVDGASLVDTSVINTITDGMLVWKTYEGAHNSEDQHNQLRLLGHI